MNKNKVIDEISENLKQTMRRINELDAENDVGSENGENQTSGTNFFKASKLGTTSRAFQQSNYPPAMNESQTKFTSFKNAGQTYQLTNESLQNSRIGFNKKMATTNNFNQTNLNANSNFVENSGFKSYSNNILKNLDNLYNDINKDFTELENFIQSAIQQ